MKPQTWQALSDLSETVNEIFYLKEIMKYGVLTNEQISQILSDIELGIDKDLEQVWEKIRIEYESEEE